MASEERRLLEQCLKPLMKDAGFRKQGPTWHRSRVDAIEVLNIQGSQWSKSFYINLGTYFKAIGNEERPKEYDCHIRQRLCVITDELDKCNSILSFENSITLEERRCALSELVSQFAIPWLETCATVEGARYYLENEKNHGLPVTKQTWEFLGIKHH
jgi:hypothetical protein